MSEEPGLRERKKQRTRAAISEAAITLFLERGFTEVPVSEIAAAAEVSRRTLFAYFPSKEDLVVHRFADHETESARVVRSRPEGTAPLDALRTHFLDGLDRRDPITGLNDVPHILALYRMVIRTPPLAARMAVFRATAERALATALTETAGTPELTARLTAVQAVAVHWALAQDNAARLGGGETADARHPGAVHDARHAFDLLAHGIDGR